MDAKRRWSWRNLSIQAKMLVIILPLIVMPMLILAAVGFITSSREAAKTSTRYLKQRENDLRTIAENPTIRDYFNNQVYGLREEAEVFRLQLEHSLRRFAERSNSIDLVYTQIRYVDPQGEEVAKVVKSQISSERGRVAEAPFFLPVKDLPAGETYLSPVGPTMIYAMPAYQPGGVGRVPTFQGAVVLDFVYPLQDFARTTAVIARTFVIITGLSLGIALVLTITRVRRLTNPIRRLAEATQRIASGQRAVTVAIDSGDEVGQLAHAFNEMTGSLEQNEAALQRKVAETTTLYEIGQEITAQVAFEPTLRLIVERTHDLLQAEVSLLALRQEESNDFLVQAHSGPMPESFAGLRIRPGQGLVGRVVETGQPIMVGNYLQEFVDSPFLEIIHESGLRSAVAVPLKARDVVIGVLYVYSRALHNFREEDRQLLSTLADQAAIALENAKLYQRVHQHAEELEARVRERTQELEEANAKLELASRHKSEFLASMSHELRTPLNAVIGFSEVLLERLFGDLNKKQAEYLRDILDSGRHLLSLINDILDLSKVEAGHMELELGRFSLAEALENGLTMVRERASRHGIALSLEVDPTVDVIEADERKIKQVVFNLLSNAVKFTPDGGQVGITAGVNSGAVHITVWDTGRGIAPEDQGRIFEEFQQVGGIYADKPEGTGLGLALAKQFVELHGGRLWLASAVGQGSRFTCTFPTCITPPVEAASAVATPTVAEPEREGPVVLVVEDDPQAAELLRLYLEGAGCRVEVAWDGEEGFAKACQLHPALITLDLLLPTMDGWDLLVRLKGDATTREIPVVIVSIKEERGKGFALGAADYLVKPISREELVSALQRAGLKRRPREAVTILAIDDDPMALELVDAILSQEGFQIMKAYGGEEGVAAARRETPALIILDLLMPEVDGFAVVERLRADPATATIPIVILTSKHLTPDEKARLNGEIACLARKGEFSRGAFLELIRGILQPQMLQPPIDADER
jgi:signal transduction histidine kinase/CheY-like chemotaxis protein